MRLKELTLRNFRGFNRLCAIDLEAQALLFYGANGRGKSTVFSALELALFPEETLAEWVEEMGERAPLTNLFYRGADRDRGEIAVTLVDDNGGTADVRQEIRQELYAVRPSEGSRTLGLNGQRYRLFFTQRLLRDLMFGMPERRHQRVKQLMGCNGYDQVLRTLYEWHRDRDYDFNQIYGQEQALRNFEQLILRLISTVRDNPVAQTLRRLLDERLDRQSPQDIATAMRDLLATDEPDLMNHIWPGGPFRYFETLTKSILRAEKRVDEIRSGILMLTLGLAESLPLGLVHLPSSWVQRLASLMAARRGAQDRFDRLVVPQLQNSGTTVNREELLRLALAMEGRPDLSAIAVEFQRSSEQFSQAYRLYGDVARQYKERLVVFREIAERLDERHGIAELLLRLGANSVRQAMEVLEHRRRFLTFTRTVYRSLLELVDEQLAARLALVKERWNMYYRSISSFSHFQHLDLTVVKSTIAASQSDRHWEIPPDKWSLARFLVADRDMSETSISFGMETLLSEGQLNCAVISLILALSGAERGPQRPSVRLLALDDPFVSWDDVNMENFMLVLRHMTKEGVTILLSTCDQRVVHSLRRNLETIHLNHGALLYTFTGWDKQQGPSFEKERIERSRAEIRYLSDLPPEEFESTPLAPADLTEPALPIELPVQGRNQSSALYYILTTRDAVCARNLEEQGRFDHLYLGQPETRYLLEQTVNLPEDRRPEVYFVYFDRVPGSSNYHKLGDVYRLAQIQHDREAGLSSRGHPMYSLRLEQIDRVGRPFTPGTALWESLQTTRDKVLKNFFFRSSRVLIRISEQEFNTILGVR